MKNTLLGWVIVLALPVGIALAEDELPFRVAGIINPDQGEPLVVIESPGGEQIVLRAGARIGDGEILEINKEFIRLRFPTGERTIWLAAGKPTYSKAPERPPEAPVIATREVSAEMTQKLQQLAAGDPSDNKRDLGSKLNALLQLPAEAHIRAVDDKPVNSPENAVRIMVEGLDKGWIPHLFISGARGIDEVYLTPAPRSAVQ